MATLDLDILQGSLEKLVGDAPEIKGAGIVSPDGLILVSTLKSREDNDKLAAMTSEMLSAGNMTVREMDLGPLFLNMVLGSQGGIIVRGIDEEMVLSAIVSRGANVGKVVVALNQTVSRLKLT
jgi:predicted regulator of Ras-like GTPase activity (Roadblock/LC7/MglB family)